MPARTSSSARKKKTSTIVVKKATVSLPVLKSSTTSPSKFVRLFDLITQALRNDTVVIIGLIILASLLRLKGITNTPTDWHAFRQADTASVTREYVKHGIDLLHPKYHDNSNIQSGKDNPLGYRMVEFPVINALDAAIVRTIPGTDLIIVSRLTALVFAVGAIIGVYLLGKIWTSRWVGLAAAIVMSILPYARFYSRAILPEAPLLFFMMWSLVLFQWWLNKKQGRWIWYLLSAISLSVAMLLKPFVGFLAPLYGLLIWQAFGWRAIFHLELLPFAAIAGLPFIWWRKWIEQYPEGIPANSWLFNSDLIRFRPAWFRWLFFERLTKLILGWTGIIPLAIGLIPTTKSWLKYAVWWTCSFLYMAVIATGNVRHDYYQVMLLPIISLTVGLGIVRLCTWGVNHTLTHTERIYITTIRLACCIMLMAASVSIAWRYVEGYYSTRPDWEIAGQAADRLLPPDAKVIAPAFGDTAFLFQTNRTGWPIGFEIDQKIAKGAEYYVTTSYDDEARMLEKKYPTITKTNDYLILRLKP